MSNGSDQEKKTSYGPSRRTVVAASMAAGFAATGATTRPSDAAMGKGPDDLNIKADGTYDVVPLRKNSISLGVVQSRVRSVDGDNPEPGIRENLDHMLELIDMAFTFSVSKDILFFHEFPLTGFRSIWNKEQALRVARQLPGPETEEIGKKAKQYGCYIVFGSYARDADWPGHLLSITTIISPDGEVVDKHWKARNIKGVFGGGTIELQTTTTFNVLDEYVEKYGADAVIPVTRTDVGNLCTTSTQLEPEIIRAFAIKGGEIMLRTATGGFSRIDIQASALYNRVYAAIVNNAHSPGADGVFEDAGGGGTSIFGPNGQVLAEVNSGHEQVISARIPIADFRARHRQPVVHWELYQPVFEKYVTKYDPNLFSAYQPTSLADAGKYLGDKSKWK